VVVSTFPRPVDAYLLRELLAVRENGIAVRIYSLRRPAGTAAPRGAAELAGATAYAPTLHAAAMRAAHRSLLGTGAGRYRDTLLSLVRMHARSPRLLAKVLAVWPQTVYFAALARREGIDHVHANWATYPAAAAFAIGRLCARPWSFAGHASDIYLEPTGLGEKVRQAAFVVTCTEESRRHLAAVGGVDPSHIHTVYHGTDLTTFGRRRREPADLHVLAVGTLRRCKGFDTLLSAIALLRAAGLPARVTIVGDGEERGALARLAEDLGLDGHAHLPGYLAHEDLVPLYGAATALALPARSAEHFGIPNVIVEAQAASLPVVCTPLPALRELIDDGRSGVYVPEDDPDALASALRSLFLAPERRRQLAAAGLERVTARFDISRTAGVLADLFGARTEGAAESRAVSRGPRLAPGAVAR
jgi:glycosyltransferase involved in cell wall biosynthesis